jgi:hypothetical protein
MCTRDWIIGTYILAILAGVMCLFSRMHGSFDHLTALAFIAVTAVPTIALTRGLGLVTSGFGLALYGAGLKSFLAVGMLIKNPLVGNPLRYIALCIGAIALVWCAFKIAYIVGDFIIRMESRTSLNKTALN